MEFEAQMDKALDFFLFLWPVMAALLVGLLRSDVGVKVVEEIQALLDAVYYSHADPGSWVRHVLRLLIAPFKFMGQFILAIPIKYWNAALWVLVFGYLALMAFLIGVYILYQLVVIVLAIAILYGIVVALSAFSSGNSGGASVEEGGGLTSSGGPPGRAVRSEERESIFGDKHTVHFDEHGNKVGESREKETLFGDKYTRHYGEHGDSSGESWERETILGDKYTQHYDESGDADGESWERDSILGDEHTKHYDESGDVTGESRERKSILGDRYTEHDKKT